MITEILPANESSVEKAAGLLKAGRLVAFPTETVYGLGANGFDESAVARIFEAKGRPQDNPLILHVAGAEEVGPLVKHVPEEAKLLIRAFWPGPLTIVLEAAEAVPSAVRAGLPTVAVRCPDNAWARLLIARCGFPLAAPSANRSGRPSPTTAASVHEDMKGKIPLILDGGPCRVGLESTVLTLANEPPRVLRPGFVTPAMIESVIGRAEVDASALKELRAGERASSPGMKYRHYAPDAAVTVVGGSRGDVAKKIRSLYDEAKAAGRRPAVLARVGNAALYEDRDVYALGEGGNAESVGEALFETLRRVDAEGRTDVFAEAVEPEGFGLAVMNRLLRAAGFRFIRL
jgi:L-threonylcarbamoyladenylate synthase